MTRAKADVPSLYTQNSRLDETDRTLVIKKLFDSTLQKRHGSHANWLVIVT